MKTIAGNLSRYLRRLMGRKFRHTGTEEALPDASIPEDIAQLLRQISSPNWLERRDSARMLAEHKYASRYLIAELSKALATESVPVVLLALIEAVEASGSDAQSVVPALCGLVSKAVHYVGPWANQDSSSGVQPWTNKIRVQVYNQVCRALVHLDAGAEAVGALIRCIVEIEDLRRYSGKDWYHSMPYEDMISEARTAVLNMGPAVVDVLVNIYQGYKSGVGSDYQISRDRRYRCEAIRMIGEFGSGASAAVPFLVRGLTSGDGDEAAVALGRIQVASREVVWGLTNALGGAHRKYAARALHELGAAARDAIPALNEVLQEEDLLADLQSQERIKQLTEKAGKAATRAEEASERLNRAIIEQWKIRDEEESQRLGEEDAHA